MNGKQAVEAGCLTDERITRLIATGYHVDAFDKRAQGEITEVGINGEPYVIGPYRRDRLRGPRGPNQVPRRKREAGVPRLVTTRLDPYELELPHARRSVVRATQAAFYRGDTSTRIRVCICKHCGSRVGETEILRHLRDAHGIVRT